MLTIKDTDKYLEQEIYKRNRWVHKHMRRASKLLRTCLNDRGDYDWTEVTEPYSSPLRGYSAGIKLTTTLSNGMIVTYQRSLSPILPLPDTSFELTYEGQRACCSPSRKSFRRRYALLIAGLKCKGIWEVPFYEART